MKKLSIFALALVITLSLTACFGGGSDETTMPATEPTTRPTTAPTTPPTTMPTFPIVDPTMGDGASDPADGGTIPGAVDDNMGENGMRGGRMLPPRGRAW